MSDKGREWNYEEARDRTGEPFQLIPHQNIRAEIQRDLKLFQDPQRFHCMNCNDPASFRLLVDAAPGDNNVIMIGCKCGIWMRAVELRVPQMSDARAKQLGITIPRNGLIPVEFDIDLEE